MRTQPPPSTEVDHYKILGLTRPVTEKEIRTAHRQRVQECHPDRGGDADEFNAVTIAYKVLIDPDRRRAYDESLLGAAAQSRYSVRVPDLIGVSAQEAASVFEQVALVPRLVLVAVPASHRLAGKIIGQLPVPGSEVDADSAVGIWLAVSSRSTLWTRLTRYTKEVAGHFWDGFLEGTGTSSSRPALTAGNLSTSAQVAGAVGTIAGATLKTGVGLGSCLLRMWLFGFGLLITFLLLAVAPPLGVVSLLVVIFLTVRSFVSRSRRRAQGLWY